MSTDPITAQLTQCSYLPAGRAKSQRLESLAAQARQGSDHATEANVLLELSRSYEYGGERERMPVVFARLMALLDDFPAEVSACTRSIVWQLKWMTFGLLTNPAVPLDTCYHWLDELTSRYRQHGYSLRPVHALRGLLATDLGDEATASAQMEAFAAAERDRMADCRACEHNDLGTWRAAFGDDTGALEHWRPVLDGTLTCQEEPHRVLGKALVPMLRSGQAGQARESFLRGYPLARHTVSLAEGVGQHIEFCALTGNEARGLEILAEHAAWLSGEPDDASPRLSFLTGVGVLLRRLSALGRGSLPLAPSSARPGTDDGATAGSAAADAATAGPDAADTATGPELAGTTVSDALAEVEQEIGQLTARFDARNGNTVVSDRVAERLDREPLLRRLRLVPAARADDRAGPDRADEPADLGPAGQPELPDEPELAEPELTEEPGGPDLASEPDEPELTVSELIEQAEQLSEARHPQAAAAWEKAAQSGADLPAAAAAQVTRGMAAALLGRDPAAALLSLLAAASQFTSLGDTGRALEARAAAAVAQALAGDLPGASEAASQVATDAETAFASGTIPARLYLAARVARPEVTFIAMQHAGQPASEHIAAAGEMVTAELALAEQHRDLYLTGTFHQMLGQLSALRRDQEELAGHLAAAAQAYLDAGQPWNAATPQAVLAQVTFQRGDPAAAEDLARQARAHAAHLPGPQLTAQLNSLLADAIGAQPDRHLEFIDASLTAAASWEGLSEPAAVHAAASAARAYRHLERHAEAAALFADVIARLQLCYTPAVIAVTRGQYGECLHALNRHHEAAEQFGEGAKLVGDDAGNLALHARLARAAADELQHSGQLTEAVSTYQRAAALFGEMGEVADRVRSLRSAAWVQVWQATHQPAAAAEPAGPAESASPDGSAEAAGSLSRDDGLDTMRAVLSELEELAESSPSEQIDAELAHTRKQLADMLGSGGGSGDA